MLRNTSARRGRASFAAALVALLLLAPAAPAELNPGFLLPVETGRARLIVRGQLDKGGRMVVEETIHGKLPKGKTIRLARGAERYAELNREKPVQGAMEVVAFLSEERKGGWDSKYTHCVVRFAGNDVYMRVDASEAEVITTEGSYLGKHPAYTRQSFLAATRQALKGEAERDRLLALPPSAERVGKLLKFLRGLEGRGRLHQIVASTAALHPIHQAEQRALLDVLKRSRDSAEQLLVLQLIRRLSLKGGLDEVSRWVDRKHPREVRIAAMQAMTRIDPHRTAEALAPLLLLDEPELDFLLSCLYSGPAETGRYSRKAADALLRLTRELRLAQRAEGRDSHLRTTWQVLPLLEQYAHPRFLPPLYAWAMADDHSSCEEAFETLRKFTGQSLKRDDRAGWTAWLRKAGPLLEAAYDLRTDAGRADWFKAYEKADAGARRLLLRLWLYETEVDEKALLVAAAGKGAKAAKTVLAELWERGRLSPNEKRAIVKKFLKPRLVERPPSNPRNPAWRELRIEVGDDFPFPKKAWVQPRSSIEVGRPPKLGDSWGALSLGDEHSHIGSMAGQYKGAPTARALLEIREVDHQDGGKVLWAERWELGPLKLRRADPD